MGRSRTERDPSESSQFLVSCLCFFSLLLFVWVFFSFPSRFANIQLHHMRMFFLGTYNSSRLIRRRYTPFFPPPPPASRGDSGAYEGRTASAHCPTAIRPNRIPVHGILKNEHIYRSFHLFCFSFLLKQLPPPLHPRSRQTRWCLKLPGYCSSVGQAEAWGALWLWFLVSALSFSSPDWPHPHTTSE